MADVPRVPELPELPDLDELKARAYQRRDHFARIEAEAAAERAKADEIIAQLTGRTATPSLRLRPISDATYEAILCRLGEHSYAGINTLATAASVSRSHVSTAMQVAVSRGHATKEKRGRRYRFALTTAGMEFLTETREEVAT